MNRWNERERREEERRGEERSSQVKSGREERVWGAKEREASPILPTGPECECECSGRMDINVLAVVTSKTRLFCLPGCLALFEILASPPSLADPGRMWRFKHSSTYVCFASRTLPSRRSGASVVGSSPVDFFLEHKQTTVIWQQGMSLFDLRRTETKALGQVLFNSGGLIDFHLPL